MKPWKAFLIVVVIMIIFGVICVYYLAQKGLLADKAHTRFLEKVQVRMALSLES